MVVEFLSATTATALAYFFATNTAFSFGKPFHTAGAVVGSQAFVDDLQYRLGMNLLAQIGPEIVCDFICIAAERFWGFGKLADEYWDKVLSINGALQFGTTIAVVIACNLAAILLTGKVSCVGGECVPGL